MIKNRKYQEICRILFFILLAMSFILRNQAQSKDPLPAGPGSGSQLAAANTAPVTGAPQLTAESPVTVETPEQAQAKDSACVKPAKKKVSLKDTLDHMLDMSDYLINMHGFVPWPVIISEPSLGNFGLALALVFISPKKTATKEEQFHFPDITGVAGMWTLNNTWGAGATRQGSFPKIGMRYTISAAYADININFYRNFTYLGEKEVLFKLKTIIGVLDVSENLFKNKLFVGLNYTYANVNVSTTIGDTVGYIFEKVFNQQPGMTKNTGLLGLYLEWDSRNTIFTPDRGIRTKASFGIGRNWTASDYDYEKSEVFINGFIPITRWWVCGLRADWQWAGGNTPFYLLPYIKMRGIGAMVYQGDQVLQLETEQRFDLDLRWSILGFVGAGKTFSSSRFLEDPSWHVAGGAGFRYLLSRIFRMRMGVDVAAGPDQWAYYIVLGHYWN